MNFFAGVSRVRNYVAAQVDRVWVSHDFSAEFSRLNETVVWIYVGAKLWEAPFKFGADLVARTCPILVLVKFLFPKTQ